MEGLTPRVLPGPSRITTLLLEELKAEINIKKKIKIITKKKDNKFEIILEISESNNKEDLIYKKKFKKNIKKYKKRIEIELKIKKKNLISKKNSDLKKILKLK